MLCSFIFINRRWLFRLLISSWQSTQRWQTIAGLGMILMVPTPWFCRNDFPVESMLPVILRLISDIIPPLVIFQAVINWWLREKRSAKLYWCKEGVFCCSNVILNPTIVSKEKFSSRWNIWEFIMVCQIPDKKKFKQDLLCKFLVSAKLGSYLSLCLCDHVADALVLHEYGNENIKLNIYCRQRSSFGDFSATVDLNGLRLPLFPSDREFAWHLLWGWLRNIRLGTADIIYLEFTGTGQGLDGAKGEAHILITANVLNGTEERRNLLGFLSGHNIKIANMQPSYIAECLMPYLKWALPLQLCIEMSTGLFSLNLEL